VHTREGRSFPWKKALPFILIALVIVGAAYAAMVYFHLHFIRHWPFLTK
jgi:flagellar basal body-associated protein FliL